MKERGIILNVDDHEAARYARSRILSSAGFRVIDASTGKETRDLQAKHQPDVILLDVHLPDANGIELCKELKAENPDRTVIVIQITSTAVTASHATASLDAGADVYLAEPVDPDVLVATVNAMLRLHQAERSLIHANRQLEIVNRELRRSNEDLQHFASAASHDLREPLRSILVFCDMLNRELREKLSEDQQEYFSHVQAGAGKMQILINDLLAYSQVGREDRPPGIVPLQEAVTTAVENLRERIKACGAYIDIQDGLPAVWGDVARMGMVFQNLISNSLHYRKADEAPTIRIQAEQVSPADWTISISDNGIGIDPSYHDQIFAPFRRLHGSERPGTGLGLAICRRIMDAYGGRIWVESTVGQGTTFYLALRAA